MSRAWQTHRERGSVFSLKLISWLSLTLGRPAGRLLLYPICVYFMIFSRGGRRASRQYLQRVLGRPAGLLEVFHHHYAFASTLLDRAFLLAGRYHLFHLQKHGLEVILPLIKGKRGMLLLGAHVGSFDLVRSFGETSYGAVVNMMMYEDNARMVNEVIASLGGKERMRVIPIGGIDSLLRAKECAERGEIIGMLADRVVASDRVVRVPFLGREAVFPAGPILLANALKVPVVLFFGLYKGGNRYEEHFELFADEIHLSRAARPAELQAWVAKYAGRLEHYCRLAPYNWFNFFDFWGAEPEQSAPPEVRTPA
jgi:predicted LPLAT superfamily acyltransferase